MTRSGEPDAAGRTPAADLAELARRIGTAPPGSAGDAEERLCRELAPRIRLYGLRHLRDQELAQELVQQVLAVVLVGLRAGTVRQPEQVVSFVFGTCRRMVQDLRRSERRRGEALQQFAWLRAASTAPTEPAVDRERLDDCLARLPERERAVVGLTFYVQRSADEIGRELRLTAGNVRVIRHRALARLRDCLGGEPGGAK